MCPEFGQQACQGRPGTRKQEVRGLINSIHRSDEQQDGMRRDGSRWVSCCCYTKHSGTMQPCLLPPRRCCVPLPPTPPLLARPRRRPPAQPQPPRNPSTLPSFLAQLATGSPAGHPAQPAHRLTNYVLVVLGWHVTRHPSPVVTWPISAEEKGEARLSRPPCCHLPCCHSWQRQRVTRPPSRPPRPTSTPPLCEGKTLNNGSCGEQLLY